MQKKLLAVAVLSAFSGVAAAQSANVTLYGTFVQNVEQVSATGGDGSVTVGTTSSRNAAAAVAGSNVIAGNLGGARVTGAANAAGVADQENRFRFNPAGSNFGLRGTEDLGNGLSAWFQIELSANFGANPPLGGNNEGRAPTMRNTGVGLRSNTWGTALFGVWDTPFNTMVNNLNANARVSGASTNHSANLLGGNMYAQGAVSGQATASWCTPVVGAGALGPTAGQCANFGMNFDRRERSSMQWWSPNWNGFELRGAYNVTQDNGNITLNNQSFGRNTLKQNIWDLTGSYTNGGLYVGYAYERQNDTLAAAVRNWTGAAVAGGAITGMASGEGTGAWQMGTAGGAAAGNTYMNGSRATGHRLGAKYAFSNGFGIGAMWESLTWNMTYGVDNGAVAAAAQNLTQLKKTAWRLQGNYTTGNHFVSLDYTRANAMSGAIASTTAAVNNTYDGSSTGARAWMVNYNYALSKRTSIGAYYNSIKNETNANYSGIVFGGITTAPGASPKYLGMQVRHSF